MRVKHWASEQGQKTKLKANNFKSKNSNSEEKTMFKCMQPKLCILNKARVMLRLQ